MTRQQFDLHGGIAVALILIGMIIVGIMDKQDYVDPIVNTIAKPYLNLADVINNAGN